MEKPGLLRYVMDTLNGSKDVVLILCATFVATLVVSCWYAYFIQVAQMRGGR